MWFVREADADEFKVLTSQPVKLRNMFLETVKWLRKKKGLTFALQNAPLCDLGRKTRNPQSEQQKHRV